MTLSVKTSEAIKELVNEALTLAKSPNDVDAMVYLNDVLEELKWKMRANQFHDFSCTINTMLKA